MVEKKTSTKKVAAKKVTPSKTVAKKTSRKSAAAKSAPMQSFRVYRQSTPFTTFRLTRQTAYWIVLLAFIVITQLWILKIQMDIATLTNAILTQ